MTTVETSSGPVECDERGAGRPIVLLTSGAHDHHDFDELRARLPERFRSIALDWPGHGSSPAGEGAATAMRFADVAEEVVERLAPEGAVIVGDSVGGFAAARLAIRRPQLVKGLVVADGGGFAGRPPHVRAFCALMARPWFLRRIYPSFARLEVLDAGHLPHTSDPDGFAALLTPFADSAFGATSASDAA